MAHPLQHVWVLWEHKCSTTLEGFSNSMREVCEFSTVEEFWKYWCFVPKPSEVLFDGQSRKGIANCSSYGLRFWSAFILSCRITIHVILLPENSSLTPTKSNFMLLSVSSLINFPQNYTEVEGRNVEAFSIFKKGIRPEWEDIVNRTGGELACRYLSLQRLKPWYILCY